VDGSGTGDGLPPTELPSERAATFTPSPTLLTLAEPVFPAPNGSLTVSKPATANPLDEFNGLSDAFRPRLAADTARIMLALSIHQP
jgi:hypothetical protein